MKTTKIVYGITLALLCLIMKTQGQYTYTTLNVPGVALGISGNYIVGYDNINESFLYNGSSFTTLSVPGGSYTEATGISGNDIVGSYEAPGVNSIGFLYNGSSYTTLSVPGAADTEAWGISGNNIVGFWWNAGPYEGFLYNGSSYITLSVPGAADTEAYGISGNNIVGTYDINGTAGTSNATQFAFIYNINSQTYTTLNVPGGTDASAVGISGNNIIGSDGNGSFLYNMTSQTFMTLSVPGASQTFADGISGNNIVGYDTTASGLQNFLATPVPEPGSFGLLAAGAGAFFLRRRRK